MVTRPLRAHDRAGSCRLLSAPCRLINPPDSGNPSHILFIFNLVQLSSFVCQLVQQVYTQDHNQQPNRHNDK